MTIRGGANRTIETKISQDMAIAKGGCENQRVGGDMGRAITL
jgi:hypothetical protein